MGAPPTQKPTQQSTLGQQNLPGRIVCRCCLSEEDEMTDYLSLDAIAAINFRDICNDDAAGSESSSSTTTTLLDCLNGCARIGATLEDATLPLHICLDCSQALEACCEFIRCVQNADKILRRKQLSAISLPKEAISSSATTTTTTEKVVDLKLLPKTTGTAGASLAEQQEHLTIGSLSLQDLIEESELHGFGLGISKNIEGQSCFENNSCQTSTVNACTAEDALHVVSCFNYDFTQNCPLLVTSLQNSKNETATITNNFKNEICEFFTTPTNSKDCDSVYSNEKTTLKTTQKDIPETHKFIPPLVKDNAQDYEASAKNESLLAIEKKQKSTTSPATLKDNALKSSKTSCNKSIINTDNVPISSNIKSTQCATLNFDGRKYIVNAAIASDLKQFHHDNEDNFNYLCKFCIFMCLSQKALDHHLITHLGLPSYSCSECHFKCRFKYYLKKHMRTTHKAVGAKLHINSDNQNALQQNKSATKYYCGICRRYFSSFIALQQHHHIDEVPCFKCIYCPKQETQREQLMEHMAAEHKVFIDAHLIATYIPNATNIQSTATSSASVDESFLSQFIKLQPKEQKVSTPHICQYCGRHFKRHFHLLRHEKLIHPKENKNENDSFLKRHTSKFVRKQYARQLLRATQAEHQFKCEPCRHVFKTHVDLIAHMQTHGNAKYQCDTCQAVFTFEFELKYHMRTHNSTSSSTSPRSEYFAPDSNFGLNKALQSRLLQLKQQKQTTRKRLALDSVNRRTISKRRLSLASVSTAKSSDEGSLNSPSNANSDEDIPPASLESSSIYCEFKEDEEKEDTPITVADVMLPQAFHRTAMRRLSSSSSSNNGINKFQSCSPFIGAHGPTSSPLPTITDKQLNCEPGDQAYLNDFDLNLLDYNDDFWLQLSSF